MPNEETPEAREQTVLLQVPITFDPAVTNPERIRQFVSEVFDLMDADTWADDVASPDFGTPGIGDVTVIGLVSDYETWIVWGSQLDPRDHPHHYSFNTEAELVAFMDGVEEASGWTKYEQFDTEQEAAEHIAEAIIADADNEDDE